jgi:peptidoglycan/LPS O-acetylase OafA/YrhL
MASAELIRVDPPSTMVGPPPVADFRSFSELPQPSGRIPQLDGLRGIAILLVVLRHAVFGLETSSRWLSAILAAGKLSWSGVDLFFVLSGFLIGGILLDARFSANYFSTFYTRRAYRILPIYLVFLALFLSRHVLSAYLPGMLGQVSPLAIPWPAYVSFTQNFWMVSLRWYGPPAMMVTWSLAVEEQFYLTIPFLIRKLRTRALSSFLVAVILAAPLLRYAAHLWLPNGDFACYVLMPCRADALCWGVLAAVLIRNRRAWTYLCSSRKILLASAAVLFAGVGLMTWQRWEQMTAPMNVWGYSWIAAFYAVCLLTAISHASPRFVACLCWRPLRSLGTIAYCTYLLHMPLIQGGRRLFAPVFPSAGTAFLVGGLAGVAATLVVASLSWKYFEKPMVQRGHNHVYRQERITLISGSAAIPPTSAECV